LSGSEWKSYGAFHRFGQAKFALGDSFLGLSQFTQMTQLPPKILLNSKVVKTDPKRIISLRKSKSVTHSVEYKMLNHRLLHADGFIMQHSLVVGGLSKYVHCKKNTSRILSSVWHKILYHKIQYKMCLWDISVPFVFLI